MKTISGLHNIVACSVSNSVDILDKEPVNTSNEMQTFETFGPTPTNTHIMAFGIKNGSNNDSNSLVWKLTRQESLCGSLKCVMLVKIDRKNRRVQCHILEQITLRSSVKNDHF